jgi:hypothetical protein
MIDVEMAVLIREVAVGLYNLSLNPFKEARFVVL